MVKRRNLKEIIFITRSWPTLQSVLIGYKAVSDWNIAGRHPSSLWSNFLTYLYIFPSIRTFEMWFPSGMRVSACNLYKEHNSSLKSIEFISVKFLTWKYVRTFLHILVVKREYFHLYSLDYCLPRVKNKFILWKNYLFLMIVDIWIYIHEEIWLVEKKQSYLWILIIKFDKKFSLNVILSLILSNSFIWLDLRDENQMTYVFFPTLWFILSGTEIWKKNNWSEDSSILYCVRYFSYVEKLGNECWKMYRIISMFPVCRG